MGLFDKKYKTSEEFLLDACYPKNQAKCLKFVQNTLRKGAPYPGDFTHEKLVVLEIQMLTTMKNTKAYAIEYASLLEKNIMPYIILSLDSKKRKDDYLHQLPSAYIEHLYDNLCELGKKAEKYKPIVAFVITFLWLRMETFEVVYDLPKGQLGYEYFEQAEKYHDAKAVEKLLPKMQATLKKVESLKAKKS